MYLNLLFMFSYASRNRIINCIKNILIEINQTSEFNSILSFYSHCIIGVQRVGFALTRISGNKSHGYVWHSIIFIEYLLTVIFFRVNLKSKWNKHIKHANVNIECLNFLDKIRSKEEDGEIRWVYRFMVLFLDSTKT